MIDTLAHPHLLAVTVHGPAGVLDLVVPAGAAAGDVAEEYAGQVGLATPPDLRTAIGTPVPADVPLLRAGVATGDVLVATAGGPPPAARRSSRRAVPADDGPDPTTGLTGLWFAGAAALAALAAWCAASAPDLRAAAVALLAVAAVVGVLPVGRHASYRLATAPAFGAAAAFPLLWDPHPARLPVVLGACGLAAALVAAVGRALDVRAEEALRVWIIAGTGLFVATGLLALLGTPPRVAWAVLLVAAVLAARFVPGLAVDVPDQYLLDLERLAVTAWSARTATPGKRGRSIIRRDAVALVADRGARLVAAATAAVLLVAGLAAPMLLATATLPIDRVGARLTVFFAGGALLLVGRSHRHVAARVLLRAAGLLCWIPLAVVLLAEASSTVTWWLVLGPVAVAVLLVVVAVAVGLGWRSAWWSRRAEVAEGLCGAFALASLLVATGWFRQIWEIASLWELSS
ncbi:ubiquitin family protein [Nocardioides pyridinolyticus]